jgi:hypothetical protein
VDPRWKALCNLSVVSTTFRCKVLLCFRASSSVQSLVPCDQTSSLVTLVLKRKADLAEWVLGISSLALSCRLELPLGPAGKVFLNISAFSDKKLVFGRNVLIQKGAEFVVDNDWGAFERTVVDRCSSSDGFPSSFNQISVSCSSSFMLAVSHLVISVPSSS